MIIKDKRGSVVCLDLASPTTTGEPPVLVEKDHDCSECGATHDMEKCPKCDSWITLGYGLMGGGIGAYKFCNNDACDWFHKDCKPTDQEG